MTLRPWVALATVSSVPALSAAAPLAPPVQTQQVTVVETFKTVNGIDPLRSGAAIDTAAGVARPGIGGGSGRLGDLYVPAGIVVQLNTQVAPLDGFGPPQFGPPGLVDPVQPDQFQTFVLDNYDGTTIPAGAQVLTVTSGVFEFASVRVDGTLRLAGANPARVLSRGDVIVNGAIEVDGRDAFGHASSTPLGGAGGLGGPAAGAGGAGGDRADVAGTELAAVVGAPHDAAGLPGPGADVDGRQAEGRGGQVPGVDDLGAGGGGVHWPDAYPGPALTQLGDLFLDSFCESDQVGAPGSGGSYATSGGESDWSPLVILGARPPAPPVTAPGASLAPVGALVLDPGLAGGALLGGAGGGGGGGGIDETETNGAPLNCQFAFVPPVQIATYYDHSAAGGGGGGGALQLQAGDELAIEGIVSARGGEGGGSAGAQTAMLYAAPGGGGSGGALLLQGRDVESGGLLDVSGGAGGENVLTESRGGDGGAGVVRLEAGPGQVLDPVAEAAQVEPLASDPSVPAGDVLATGEWLGADLGPAARSGLQSCWQQRPGFGNVLSFVHDVDANGDGVLDPAAGDAAGWDATVVWGGREVSWRTLDPLLTPSLGQTSLEQLFGTALADLDGPILPPLGGSPFVVRFQGVRLSSRLDDPCGVPDFHPQLVPGSLTPWVLHPAELNAFAADPDLRPNAFRWQVVFDPNPGGLAQLLDGLVEVRIETSVH